MTVFCCDILSWSPSSSEFNESATFPTTPSAPLESFPRSSACCTSASSVPILNEGMVKGEVSPLSVVMVERRAVRASSRSFEGEIDVGSDTRKKDDLDMVWFDRWISRCKVVGSCITVDELLMAAKSIGDVACVPLPRRARPIVNNSYLEPHPLTTGAKSSTLACG